jgi:hypothetical protein
MSEPREAIAQALTGFLSPEQVKKLIDEVLSIEKRASAEFNCRKCGARQMQWGMVTDAKAVASALTDLANQAFGRPGEASAQQDPIQFYRLTNLEDADAVRDSENGRRGHQVERRKDGEVRRQAGRPRKTKAQRDSDL